MSSFAVAPSPQVSAAEADHGDARYRVGHHKWWNLPVRSPNSDRVPRRALPRPMPPGSWSVRCCWAREIRASNCLARPTQRW